MKTIWRPVRFQLDPPETIVTLSGKPQSSSAKKVGTALAVAILVVSAFFDLLAQAAPAGKTQWIWFETIDQSALPIVRAKLNGSGGHRLVIDPSFNDFVLDTLVVDGSGLKLPAQGQAEIDYYGRKEKVPVVLLEELKVGELAFSMVRTLLVDGEDGTGMGGLRSYGRIGRDLLEPLRLTIHYPRRLLYLESSPAEVPAGGVRFESSGRFLMVPVVLFGVLLSTLHQSSLGAVYLIAPSKLSPLWYSNALPSLFLISAVMLALSMVSFETILSSRAFHHELPVEVLKGLARGTLIVGGGYLAIKLIDLARGPGIGLALNGSFLSNLWLLEMGVGVALPLILLSFRSIRTDINRIFVVNILVILGVMLNRVNVGIFGVAEYATGAGGDYFPSFIELMVTAAMVAFAVLGFKVCAKYLNLYPETLH